MINNNSFFRPKDWVNERHLEENMFKAEAPFTKSLPIGLRWEPKSFLRPLRRRKKTTQEKTALVKALVKEEWIVRKETEIRKAKRGVGSSGREE